MKNNAFIRFSKEIYAELSNGKIAALSYIAYYPEWKKTLQPGKTAIADEQPWISFPVRNFLEEHINSDTLVFEYGCGGSTAYFVNRVKMLATVEHDPYWFGQLNEKISKKGKSNWEGHLVVPETHEFIQDLDPSVPQDYYTSEETYANCTFRNYAACIDRYPDQHFDFVLVDGRSRPSCISHSIAKIKPGGFLVVDNSNRKHYLNVFNELLPGVFDLVYNRKAPSPYASYFTQTGLWRKSG